MHHRLTYLLVATQLASSSAPSIAHAQGGLLERIEQTAKSPERDTVRVAATMAAMHPRASARDMTEPPKLEGGQKRRTESSPPYRTVTMSEYAVSVVGPGAVLGTLARAGLDQATRSPGSWSRDWSGYQSRASARGAELAMTQTLLLGMSAAVGERPAAWAPCTCSGTRSRLMHGLAMPFVVQRPTGFGHSAVMPLSRMGGAILTTSVYPGGFSARDGLVNGLADVLFSAAGSAAREFLPPRWQKRLR
jgi:hypothetical protein